MPSLTMKSGSQILQSFLEVGVPASLKGSGHLCFSCEQIFANRKCLEDHLCPSASFICSCGTEFTEYKGMLEHSTTHQPGQQVLDHMTIKKRRIEKFVEQDEKLKRLQKGEIVWSPSNAVKPSVSGRKSSALPQTVQIPQVPVATPSLSDASLLPNALPAAKGMQTLYSDVGAPTVDLWTIYQPVVLVPTIRKLQKPYICGKCGQGFMSKALLVSHHNLHVADKVSGCIGCGLLLSGRKQVPRFHSCNSPVTHKFKLITAKPPNYKSPIKDNVRKNLLAQPLQAASALQLENLIPGAARKVRRPGPISAQKNIRTYNNSVHVGSVFQPKILNPIAPKAPISVSLSSKSPNLSVFSSKISIPPTVQLKMPTSSESLSSDGEFMCRVCHLPFRTAQILQRHKCVKAQEFMAKHVIGSKIQPKPPLSMGAPNSAQVNGERKPGFPPSVGTKSNQLAVGLDKGKAPVPGKVPGNKKTGEEDDDDCFIVEDGSNKPAEMIYQVTSSVPIKI
ncbi:uncharacterized protein LOC106537148 [Austrofundulus limnaeus]|uniref:Uncharacterized protein LOC106537148 n=1 Tax=Austrofundulus limnaeus TaxID=52670 RepID=A0A2I4DCN0_AUSLI|nr:PREDICTED: uncharacterized protein LOC106537148 [Austrofundulus limnaeus]